MTQVYVDDVVAWLRGREWLVQNGYLPRYHAVLCDPPYFLGSIVKRFGKPDSAPAQYGTDGAFQRASRGFMGQTWDGFESPWHYQEWVTEWATLLLSFVYPGAVLLAFGGTRTFHRLAAGLEDAGWIIADTIAWITGQGFPKSHNGRNWDAGEHWHGYGTALKPAWEGVVVARAPWRGTYAALAREFGTGAINVDGGRIQFANNEPYSIDERCRPNTRGTKRKPSVVDYVHEIAAVNVSHFGRWPANLILGCACESAEHDADCPVRLLGEQSGERAGSPTEWTRGKSHKFNGATYNGGKVYRGEETMTGYGDTGTAARFFKTVGTSPICVLCNLPIGLESSRIQLHPTEGVTWPNASSVDGNTVSDGPRTVFAHGHVRGNGQRENADNSLSNDGLASTAAKSSRSTHPTGTPTAQNSAPMMPDVQSALSARFAGSLCASCVTAIAQSIAVMRLGQNPESLLCQAFMPEHSAHILSQNLVRYAASLESIDITTITITLSRLLGFVQLAIESIIAEASSGCDLTRFRYVSKAAAWEREAGLGDAPMQTRGSQFNNNGARPHTGPDYRYETRRANHHPTVKPIALTEYLARLILPPTLPEPRRLLVPFAGSGSEMIGARLAGWDVVHGIEQSADYADIARARLAWWSQFENYEQAQYAYKKDKKRRQTKGEVTIKQLPLAGEWS